MVAYAILGLMVLLSGCGIGPTYKKPKVQLPQKYSRTLGGNIYTDEKCWWKLFQDPQLEILIDAGLKQNFDFKIALEKIEESRNLNRIQIANLLPQINLFSGIIEANFGNIPLLNTLPNTSITSKVVAADTLWEIDIWGRLRKNQKVAQYQWQAQIEDMRDVLIMFTAEIAQTYITICSLQKKIETLRKSLAFDEHIVTLYKDAVRSGIDDEPLFLEQETSTEQFKTQIISYIITQQQACHKLAYLIGQTPDQLDLDLHDIDDVPLPQKEFEIDKPYELLRRRPDIRKNERLLAASYEQIGATMAEWFPKISLLGLLGSPFLSGCGLTGGNNATWLVGPIFNWPVLDFGRIYFNVKAKQSSQKQALLIYEKTVINAVKEVEDWLIAYIEENKTFAILQEKFNAENKRLQLTQDLFTSGLESHVTLLANQKRLNEIIIERTDNKERISSDFITLYKALGGSW